MFLPLTLMILINLILTILLIILNLFSKKTFNDREKSSPFECGFDPKSNARLPFSLQFFLIAIIFLIFDVEITLLLPFIMIINYTNMMMLFTLITFFSFILIIGLYHEWNQGALQWIY
uniref:NADH-ubiquinone oxidoreductase chain 3 n=1 Tax=Cucujoidea sp. 44 KM-2017 TaxID=2219383 RepID=A0A346RHG9_9CUCU|nr:NADH dehydrogenase subunit 3 [Cucujoidea sp. 44 KM-2017]